MPRKSPDKAKKKKKKKSESQYQCKSYESTLMLDFN